MENKNEDSRGSDSLDKTLQQKCKVDDANQCISKSLEVERVSEVSDCVGDNVNIKEKSQIQMPEFDQEQNEQVQHQNEQLQHQNEQLLQSQNSSAKLLKTETYLMGDGINAAATVARETSLRFFKASSTITNTMFSRDDSDSNSSNSSYGIGGNSNNHNTNSCTSSNKDNGISNSVVKNSGTHNIEKKVKQISQNLQDTTLEMTKAPVEESASLEAGSSTSSYCAPLMSTSTSAVLTSASSTTSLLDNEQPGPSRSDSTSNSESTLSHSELDTNSLAANDSTEDNSDHRSKKVRFHPDVKENDGGNRITPKKKKKIKLQIAEDSHHCQNGIESCNDMEFDDNVQESDDEEPEDYDDEVFDIEKTISEAENYLKQHPITFVPSMTLQTTSTNLKVPFPSGLMTEDHLESTEETKNIDVDEKVTEEVIFENGIECLLGKRLINGSYYYLLRYMDKSNISWESEDFVNKNCPKLVCNYKKAQQQQQEDLVKYVAKRQNLRQRYTDF